MPGLVRSRNPLRRRTSANRTEAFRRRNRSLLVRHPRRLTSVIFERPVRAAVQRVGARPLWDCVRHYRVPWTGTSGMTTSPIAAKVDPRI